MGAAAQFGRIWQIFTIAHAQHTNFITVFFAEQRHRTRSDSSIGSHQPRRYGAVSAYLGVDHGFDNRNIFNRQRLGLAEIKTQPIGGDE